MRNVRAVLAGLAALTLGGSLVANAQLGTGGAVRAAEPSELGAPDRAATESEAASRISGSCVANRVSFRTQTNVVATTSTAFVTMDNTHLSVTHAAGCLIVDFAGEVFSSSSTGRKVVRAFIAGIGVAEPPFVRLGAPVTPGVFETRSMRFVFPNVPAGTHTVRIEWRNEVAGTAVTSNRTLTVQHR